MADPQTVNVLLSIPARGSNVGVWDTPVNGDFVAIDGFQGGVTTIGLTNVPVTLTAPAGSVTPSPGPTQAQNAVLRLTGALSGNVAITLPLPGYYIVENLTTGAFVVTLRGVTATQVIGIDQGMCQHVYNDGANVRFVNLGETGKMEFWSGYSAIPAWVSACTVAPYLLCDGATFNFSSYPYLGARYGSNFGGNGITTAATPDMRGRIPLAYDGTGTRITVAGAGLNGQTLGASLDHQSNTLAANQIPTITAVNAAQAISVTSTIATIVHSDEGIASSGAPGGSQGQLRNVADSGISAITSTGTNSISATYTNASQQVVGNVQPTQVAGIWVVRAA